MNNEQRSSKTRASILDAATLAIARDGYDSTGVAEICESAGVSKGAFYYHFESKEAVFLELITCWLDNLESTLQDAARGAENVPAALLEMADLVRPVFEGEQVIMGLFMELWTHASRNEKVRAATIEPYRRYRDIFTELFRRGIEEGALRQVDHRAAGQMLLSLSSGIFMQSNLDPQGADWGRVLRESVEMILNGLKKE